MTNDSQDRGYLLTEQRLAASAMMDTQSTEQVLTIINDQDATVPGIVRHAIGTMSKLVDDVIGGMNAGGRLIYFGAGTSGRLGVLDASECPPTFFSEPGEVIGIIAGGDGALRVSSEKTEDDPGGPRDIFEAMNLTSSDVVVGIAASGTTPWVWGGLAYAQSCGAVTGLICCVPDPRRLCALDHLIALPVGPEVVTGSTRMKAGTATKLALNMISTSVMVGRGKVWGNLIVDLRATNAKLRDRAARILMHQCDLDRTQAMALLDDTQGKVKVALVMAMKNLNMDEALKLLESHHQKLYAILGSPR